MDGERQYRKEIIDYLKTFVADTRLARFDEVIKNRTSHVRVVLENLYQAHNASAVLRTCDCFGIQHVHFIENRNSLRISEDVALGSASWLTVHRHRGSEDNTAAALSELHDQGYRIVVTTPHEKSRKLHELPVNSKLALVFGTELSGASETAMRMADEFVMVPMYGFTESFNISVCAALCIYDITSRMRSSGNRYDLSGEEREEVMLGWLKATVTSPSALIKDFLHKKQR